MNKGVISHASPSHPEIYLPSGKSGIVTDCFCPNGHSLIDDLAIFSGHQGITIGLKYQGQEGRVSLSPRIGDKSRTFFNFNRVEGSVVDICCPDCGIDLPVYNQCQCGAYLVAMFNTPGADFANCIGICQRIGCLNAEIIGTYDLRRLSRNGFI